MITANLDVLIEKWVRWLRTGTEGEIAAALEAYDKKYLPALEENQNLVVFSNDWRDGFFTALGRQITESQKLFIFDRLVHKFEPDKVLQGITEYLTSCPLYFRILAAKMLFNVPVIPDDPVIQRLLPLVPNDSHGDPLDANEQFVPTV